MALQVELVSPEQVLYSGECTQVIARTVEGEIGFLSGHAPFIGALGVGVVRLTSIDGQEHKVAVHGGFVEVSNNSVTLLSDVAELADSIDIARAQEAILRADAALKFSSDDAEAADAKLRALTRLAAAGVSTS